MTDTIPADHPDIMALSKASWVLGYEEGRAMMIPDEDFTMEDSVLLSRLLNDLNAIRARLGLGPISPYREKR